MQARGVLASQGRMPTISKGVGVRVRPCRVVAKAVQAPERFIPKWNDCYDDLRAKGLKTVSPEESSKLLKSGKWALIDVRRPDQFEESHPEGAVSIPMYRLIDTGKLDLAKVMKVIAYSFNGVQAIESNSNFTSEALAAAPGKKFIILCEAGGTMTATVNFPQGKASRSLQAAYKLMNEAGLTSNDVVHLERGLYGWYQAGLPINGEYTPDVGRTPMAASDPQTVAGQAVAYETKEGDKPMEPAAKKNWFGF